jgi:hypothetical protein
MAATTSIPEKSIRYQRATKDYAMYLNGQYIGSRETYSAAETELDAVVTEQAGQLAADVADEQAGPVDIPDEPQPPTEGGPGPDDVSLSDIRACVDASPTIGALAALVSSGVYLYARSLLVARPELPDPLALAGPYHVVALHIGAAVFFNHPTRGTAHLQGLYSADAAPRVAARLNAMRAVQS